MAIYDDKTAPTKPTKRPLNLHLPTHERFFRLRDLQRQRTGKPAMVAEDFLVDLMDLFETQLEKEAAESVEP